MGSKHGTSVKRFPQVEESSRSWLYKEYVTRGLTGPMTVDNHEVAKGTGRHVGTTGTVLLQMSKNKLDGLTRLSPGTYNYEPPAVIRARFAEQPKAPAPTRTLDMTVRPKLIQYARDTWERERRPTIVIAKLVAQELKLHIGSTQGAMRALASEYPEVGYRALGGTKGTYEIIKPRGWKPPEPEVPAAPEADGGVVLSGQEIQRVVEDMAPQARAATEEPVWPPEPQPVAAPEVPQPEPEPSPTPRLDRLMADTGPLVPTLWELKTTLSEGQVLQVAEDGTYWVARKLDLP